MLEHTSVLPPVPPMPPAGPYYGSAVPSRSTNLLIPFAVVVAVLLIAGGVVWIVLAGRGNSEPPRAAPNMRDSPTPSAISPSPPADSSTPNNGLNGNAGTWGTLSNADLPGGGSYCQDDSQGLPVSEVSVSDGDQTDRGSECQFALMVQSAYEAQVNGGTDPSGGLVLNVNDADGNQITMTCGGTGPVQCNGPDAGSSDAASDFSVLMAYGNGNQVPDNGAGD